jgi:hypothetical protein
MGQTAQSCAKEACEVVKRLVSGKGDEMIDDDEGRNEDGEDGGEDDGEDGGDLDGGGGGGGGDPPTIEEVGDPKKVSGAEAKAKKVVALCEIIIKKTVLSPPRAPNVVGAFHAPAKKPSPTLGGSGNGGIARVEEGKVLHVRALIKGVLTKPPPSSSSPPPATPAALPPPPLAAAAAAAAEAATTTPTATTPTQVAGAEAPPASHLLREAAWFRELSRAHEGEDFEGKDDFGFTSESARLELASHLPLPMEVQDFPVLVPKPSLVGGKTTHLREQMWLRDEEWSRWTCDINTAIPSPLVTVSELPSAPMTGPNGEDLQPPAASATLFLSARVRMQLAWVERVRVEAQEHVTRCELLRQADADGVKPISKMPVGALRKLLQSRGLVSKGLKKDLAERLFAHAGLPASAADKELRDLVKLEGGTYKPPIPLSDFERFAANAVLAEMQSEGLKQGSTSRLPTKGEALAFTDPYHLFHNMTTLLIFGKDDTRPILNRPTLLEAAKVVGDTHLISILSQTVDKHSHMATHYLMTHKGLTKELRKHGPAGFRDAVILETIGRARQAWEKPHFTRAWRTKALQATTLLLLRVFGSSIRDVGALRRQKLEGTCFTVNQFLDLLANTEARHQYMASLSDSELAAFKETTLSTRALESSFSSLTANMGSGEKMTQAEIQGVVWKLDALLVIKMKADKSYTIVHSRRKRKFEVCADVGFNTPSQKKTETWDKIARRSVGGYIGGRAPCNRDFNAAAGGVGKR